MSRQDWLASEIALVSGQLSSADIEETPIWDGSLFSRIEAQISACLARADLPGGDPRVELLREALEALQARPTEMSAPKANALFSELWELADTALKAHRPRSRIAAVALLVPDYDAAIAFYTRQAGFDLLEDTDMGGGKRWVRIAPPGGGAELLLAKAVGETQAQAIGNQTGGRVGFFLETDDFARDHAAMTGAGVTFEEARRHERYGTVAVWRDPWGNRWDLIERT